MHTARLRKPYLIGEHHLIENVIFVEAHLCALTQRWYAEFGGDILVFPCMLCHLRHSTFTRREYPYKAPFPIDQPAWCTKDGDIPFLRPLRAIEFNCLCDFAAKTFSTTGDALHKTQPFQLASYLPVCDIQERKRCSAFCLDAKAYIIYMVVRMGGRQLKACHRFRIGTFEIIDIHVPSILAREYVIIPYFKSLLCPPPSFLCQEDRALYLFLRLYIQLGDKGNRDQ